MRNSVLPNNELIVRQYPDSWRPAKLPAAATAPLREPAGAGTGWQDPADSLRLYRWIRRRATPSRPNAGASSASEAGSGTSLVNVSTSRKFKVGVEGSTYSPPE